MIGSVAMYDTFLEIGQKSPFCKPNGPCTCSVHPNQYGLTKPTTRPKSCPWWTLQFRLRLLVTLLLLEAHSEFRWRSFWPLSSSSVSAIGMAKNTLIQPFHSKVSKLNF